jgi:hypothetical protein
MVMNDLMLGENSVYGERYYTVEPRMTWDTNWYVQNWNDMESWCNKNFGSKPKVVITPNARWYAFNGRFYFKDQEDQMMFVLKWS